MKIFFLLLIYSTNVFSQTKTNKINLKYLSNEWQVCEGSHYIGRDSLGLFGTNGILLLPVTLIKSSSKSCTENKGYYKFEKDGYLYYRVFSVSKKKLIVDKLKNSTIKWNYNEKSQEFNIILQNGLVHHFKIIELSRKTIILKQTDAIYIP